MSEVDLGLISKIRNALKKNRRSNSQQTENIRDNLASSTVLPSRDYTGQSGTIVGDVGLETEYLYSDLEDRYGDNVTAINNATIVPL